MKKTIIFITIFIILVLTVLWASATASEKPFHKKAGISWNRDDECLDAREKALRFLSLSEVELNDECNITKGHWLTKFTGAIHETPGPVVVSQTVPLKWAIAHGLTEEKEKEYKYFTGNTYHIVAVDRATHEFRQNKGPLEWIPEHHRCNYISTFLLIVGEWNLKLSDVESVQLKALIDRYCRDRL